jgi:hypothetical protein
MVDVRHDCFDFVEFGSSLEPSTGAQNCLGAHDPAIPWSDQLVIRGSCQYCDLNDIRTMGSPVCS